MINQKTLEPEQTPETSGAIHTSDPQTPFTNTLTELRKPVSRTVVKSRPGNKDRNGDRSQFNYVPWNEVANILDDTAPHWGHAIKQIQVIGDFVVITVAITIDGVTREGVGTGRSSDETGIKKAEHDALKRAAVKFGVARELYNKEILNLDSRPGSASQYNFDIHTPPSNPKAVTAGDRLTEKQLRMVHSLCRDLDINPYDECDGHLKCNVDDLNKKAASWFISYLQELQQGNEEAAAQLPATNSNVTNIADRSSSKPTVSPETKAKLMIDNGEVSPAEHGFDVIDHTGGSAWTAKVTIDTAKNAVTCSCGEFKNAALKGNNSFMCCHKIAVEMFTQRQDDAS